jgi:hypothetical protein
VALVVAATATQARAQQPDVAGLEAYELPTYTIVTDNEIDSRPVPRLVAQMEGTLAKLFERETRTPSSPTYVVLVPHDTWLRYLRPGQGSVGEFVPAKFANYLLVHNALDDSARERAIFHEYSHWFLHTQFAGLHPLWFDEGLAEFVETAEFRDTVVTLGIPASTIPLGWIPLERLFRLTRQSPEYLQQQSSSVVHRQSWAIVHRGMAGDPQFGQQIFAYLDAINAQQPVDAAAKASFGIPLDDLDRKIYAYLKPGDRILLPSAYKVMRLPVDPVPAQKLPRGRVMSQVESLQFVADIMLASGFNSERLPEVIDAIHRVAPHSAAEVALRMRVAARKGDDAALDELLGSIKPNASNPVLLRGVALALYERAGEPAGAKRAPAAFELLDRAIMSRPDDAEAIWAYAMLSAQLERDVPIALRRILAMREMFPANPDLAQATALLHRARGDSAGYVAALRDTLRLAKEPKMSQWAKERLDEQSAP